MKRLKLPWRLETLEARLLPASTAPAILFENYAAGEVGTPADSMIPIITAQPTDQDVVASSSATFVAAASGTPAPTVQWYVNVNDGSGFTPISGATSTSLTVSNVSASQNGYEYAATFTNSAGSAATNVAILFVNAFYADTRWVGLAAGTQVDADPVRPGFQSAMIGTTAFATVNGALTAAGSASGNASVILNGDGGSGQNGNFSEAVSIASAIPVVAQYGAVTLKSLGDSSSSGTIELNGTSLTIGGDNSSKTIAATITGTGNIVKIGSGTLTLSNSGNTYTGTTTVNGGQISITTDSDLGTAPTSPTPGSLVLAGGGIAVTGNATLSAARGIAIGPASGTGNAFISVSSNRLLTYNGSITNNGAGVGNLLVSGLGTLSLGGTNSYTGSTTLLTGFLVINTDASLGTAPAAPVPADLSISGGTLTAAGSFTLNANRGIAIGPAVGSGAGTISVSPGNALAYNGVIANKGTGTDSLIFTGTASILNLGGANTYNGSTTINSGTLAIASDNALGAVPASATPANVVINQGILLAENSFTLNSNRGIALGPTGGGNTGEIDVSPNQVLSYGGIVSNNGNNATGLIINTAPNTGKLVLSGNSTYSGTTAVNAGTLIVSGTLNAGSTVIAASAATVGGSGRVGPTSISGSLTPGGPALLSTGELGFNGNAAYNVVINGAAAGSGYDQVVVDSPLGVSISSNATLNVVLNFTPTIGASFTIISDSAGGSVTGNFANGTSLLVGQERFSISYTGGTGGDVVLTALGEVTATSLMDNGPNPSTTAQSIGLTVTVSGGIPDGEKVTIEDASNNDAIVSTSGDTLGSGIANVTIAASALSPGAHSLFAIYAGDATYIGSQSNTVVQIVNPVTPISITAINVNAGSAPIIAASETGSVVTITTDGPNGFAAGDPVVIANLGSGYNGSYVIASASTYAFTINFGTTGLPTVTNSGLATDTAEAGGILVNGASSATSQRSMVDSIVYKFDQAVILGSGAFIITATGNNPGTVPSISYTSPDGGTTWVVTFSGNSVIGNSIANGEYQIVLNNSAVAAISGGGMLATGDTEKFYRLFGDTVGNGHYRVSALDRNALGGAFGTFSTQINFLAFFDSVGNGRVNSVDRNFFNGDFGTVFSGFTATI